LKRVIVSFYRSHDEELPRTGNQETVGSEYHRFNTPEVSHETFPESITNLTSE